MDATLLPVKYKFCHTYPMCVQFHEVEFTEDWGPLSTGDKYPLVILHLDNYSVEVREVIYKPGTKFAVKLTPVRNAIGRFWL